MFDLGIKLKNACGARGQLVGVAGNKLSPAARAHKNPISSSLLSEKSRASVNLIFTGKVPRSRKWNTRQDSLIMDYVLLLLPGRSFSTPD